MILYLKNGFAFPLSFTFAHGTLGHCRMPDSFAATGGQRSSCPVSPHPSVELSVFRTIDSLGAITGSVFSIGKRQLQHVTANGQVKTTQHLQISRYFSSLLALSLMAHIQETFGLKKNTVYVSVGFSRVQLVRMAAIWRKIEMRLNSTKMENLCTSGELSFWDGDQEQVRPSAKAPGAHV